MGFNFVCPEINYMMSQTFELWNYVYIYIFLLLFFDFSWALSLMYIFLPTFHGILFKKIKIKLYRRVRYPRVAATRTRLACHASLARKDYMYACIVASFG